MRFKDKRIILLVEKPEASDGQVYIVVRKYTDGTMNAIKIRN